MFLNIDLLKDCNITSVQTLLAQLFNTNTH